MLIFNSDTRSVKAAITPYLVKLAKNTAEFELSEINMDVLIERVTLDIVDVACLLQQSKIDVCAYSAYLTTVGDALVDLKKVC